jgi:hypothetical protein
MKPYGMFVDIILNFSAVTCGGFLFKKLYLYCFRIIPALPHQKSYRKENAFTPVGHQHPPSHLDVFLVKMRNNPYPRLCGNRCPHQNTTLSANSIIISKDVLTAISINRYIKSKDESSRRYKTAF